MKAATPPPTPAAGDYKMTAADFANIAEALRSATGISLSDGKAPLVYSRLAKRLRTLGLENFRAYCDLLQEGDLGGEVQHLIAAMTTNVTSFFREPHHFDALSACFAETLAHRARQGGRVRLWSAACSNGAEPYSMAMTILSAMPDAQRFDVRVLATDIDPNMVDHARRATYSKEALAPLSSSQRQQFFRHDDGYAVTDDVRALVQVNPLNLNGPWPMKGKFDIIFCRNVAIYFDEHTQEKLWARFAEVLNPGGLLCIGHSERITGPGMRFLQASGLTSYKRVGL
jgi:chemotaxis protein methyltransferase CheR